MSYTSHDWQCEHYKNGDDWGMVYYRVAHNIQIWRFSRIVVLPNHPCLFGFFFEINKPSILGCPNFRKTPSVYIYSVESGPTMVGICNHNGENWGCPPRWSQWIYLWPPNHQDATLLSPCFGRLGLDTWQLPRLEVILDCGIHNQSIYVYIYIHTYIYIHKYTYIYT